jgi:phasin family protein
VAEGEIVQGARRRGRPPKASALAPAEMVAAAEAAAAETAKAVPAVTKAPRKIAKNAARAVAMEADVVAKTNESVAGLAASSLKTAADAADQVSSAVAETATDMVAAAETVTAETQPLVTASFDESVVETPAAEEAADRLKGFFPMATAPATAQALFSEMNDRAKGAYDKSIKVSEELVEFTKGNVEALVTSARVAAKGTEALAQDAAEYGKKSFESATTAFKSFASVKSPTELFQLQSDYAKSSFDGAVAEASKLSEGVLKLFGDIFQPLSSRYAVATEKFKATAL